MTTHLSTSTLSAWRRISWQRAFTGFCLGALTGTGFSLLGLCTLAEFDDTFLLMGCLGLLLWQTRLRCVLAALAGIVLFVMGMVAYTPLVSHLLPRLLRRDVLQSAPAVVVLSSHVQKEQTLSAPAQERILQGYRILRTGLASRLVLTNATVEYGSQAPLIREQMRMLGLNYPVEEAGKVQNTHDEALAVARLAKRNGWTRVILVTHPWHSRRAAAVFEKAGLPVLCAPCVEGNVDMAALTGCSDRLAAFRLWLHEAVGYQIYKWHGWVN